MRGLFFAAEPVVDKAFANAPDDAVLLEVGVGDRSTYVWVGHERLFDLTLGQCHGKFPFIGALVDFVPGWNFLTIILYLTILSTV